MILINNGYIKPMVGKDIENSCVLVDDNGKIAKVGGTFKVSIIPSCPADPITTVGAHAYMTRIDGKTAYSEA